MLEHKVRYPYDQIDASNNRNLYMYSDYGGTEFLQKYFESRHNVLKQIGAKNVLQIKKKEDNLPSFDLKIPNSEEIIDLLLYANPLQPTSKLYLDHFLKKFEVMHRILLQYGKDAPNSKKEISLISYMKLAYLFAEHTKTRFSLKYLNSLLKINDKVIFLLRNSKWSNKKESEYISYAIYSEINLIKDLFEKCQK